MKQFIRAFMLSLVILVGALTLPGSIYADESNRIDLTEHTVIMPAFQSKSLSQIAPTTQATYTATTLEQLSTIIEESLQYYTTSVSINYRGDTSLLQQHIETTIDDQRLQHDYLRGVLSEWGYQIQGVVGQVTIELKFLYFVTPEQEAFVQSEVKRITAEIIDPTMSNVEKAKAVHDYVVLNANYSEATTTSPHSPYTLLNEGEGVCQAYALLTYRLMQEAGLQVRYVTGWVGDVAHAWNLVQVDGEWYHMDTTWDDPIINGAIKPDYIYYKYFLISDHEISFDHKRDNQYYPPAISERFQVMRTIEVPVTVGQDLYYSHLTDAQKLYKINFTTPTVQAEKVSDIRVQHLFYESGWLYFSNYSNNGFLYKMKVDGSQLTLLKNTKVDLIESNGIHLVAYYGNVEVYREAVVPTERPDFSAFYLQMDQLVFLSANFQQSAEQILATYNQFSATERLHISAEQKKKLAEIKAKYDQLLAHSLEPLPAWGAIRTVQDVKKTWTITLNGDVLNTSDNLKHIELLDMFGEPVAHSVQIQTNKVIVTPKESYVKQIPYTLVVHRELKSTAGEPLEQGAYLSFQVK